MAASVPALGSVRPKAPSFSPVARSGRYFSFCSWVPKCSMGQQHREVWAEMVTPVLAQALEISSTAMTYSRVPIPTPPNSSATGMPRRPISPILGISSKGKRSCSSSSAAMGRSSLSTNSRNMVCMSCCSSFHLNSTEKLSFTNDFSGLGAQRYFLSTWRAAMTVWISPVPPEMRVMRRSR